MPTKTRLAVDVVCAFPRQTTLFPLDRLGIRGTRTAANVLTPVLALLSPSRSDSSSDPASPIGSEGFVADDALRH
jgi:hypothetical protein